MRRQVYLGLFVFITTLLYATVSPSPSCNSCAAAQKEQKQQPSQYYLLADSSILGGVGVPPSGGDGIRPEILAISELKSKPEICSLLPSSPPKPTAPSSSSKRCIQTFDPYTTIIQTLYGTHTELATTTQCVPFPGVQMVAPTPSAFQAFVQLPPSFLSQQQQYVFPYPSFPAPSNQPLPTSSSRCTELLSNNQLLGLIHEQLCVGNDRLRQMFNEVMLRNATTSYITRTILSTASLSHCALPTSSAVPQFAGSGIIPPSFSSPICMFQGNNNGFNHPQMIQPQMRLVVATSTYMLPVYGTYAAPSPDCPCRQTATSDSF